MAFLSKQPVKGMYVLLEVLIMIFFRLPIWICLALPKEWRTRPSWSFKRELMITLIKWLISVITNSGPLQTFPDYHAVTEGESVNAVWIPAAPHLVVGQVKKWAQLAEVEAISIPGYWYGKEGSSLPPLTAPHAKPGEKILLAFHGGAYARQTAHPKGLTANLVHGVLKHSPANVHRCLSVEYRLSKAPEDTPSNPFPAALIDAIAAYDYMVNESGFSPEDVILLGDSAGGNLALALARYLVEHQYLSTSIDIPRPPGGLILCSPMVNMGPPPKDPSSSAYLNIPCDVINIASPLMRELVNNFVGPLGHAGAAAFNPYISPASSLSADPVSFQGFPRTFILCGTAEVMRDDIRTLHANMVSDLGSDLVTFVETPDATHDFLLWLWHEPERTEVLGWIGDWIASN